MAISTVHQNRRAHVAQPASPHVIRPGRREVRPGCVTTPAFQKARTKRTSSSSSIADFYTSYHANWMAHEEIFLSGQSQFEVSYDFFSLLHGSRWGGFFLF
ncbi:hypothetical protein H0G86_012733 [Trichoderma simmonsii]|uniref:Uncharacterized protein n=1 Tax=Trichoderma simmonsii TaxID=1491479 RepID=A0A8G0PNL6_9HYPO|nr:hypothetical protein H0G86_012733 [Trichoderma simmonsii]